MFRTAKDWLSSRALISRLNQQIARYGFITELTIDSQHKRIRATGRLHGEKEDIRFECAKYTVATEGDSTWLQLRACSCDRVWLQHVLEDHVQFRAFPVPKFATILL